MCAFWRLAAAAVVASSALTAIGEANELLTNTSIEIATSPPGWQLEEFASNPAFTFPINTAQTAGFANQEADGQRGLWFRSFQGATFGSGAEATNAVLSQTVPGVAGDTYTFSGWSQFEGNYSGGLALLDILSPLGEVPSPTETRFELAFLDSSDAVIGTPVTLDLRTEQFNGLGWAQHTLNGVAPVGTANVRVSASALDMVPNINPSQSAFVDTFSLTAGSAPSVQLLENENFQIGSDSPPGWVIEEGEGGTARYEGFAARTGANGFWIAPRSADTEPLDALFTQTTDATPGDEYTLSGWSFFEPSYAGGVATLNPESPFGAIASDTETFFLLEFLDGAGALLASNTLDLRTVQQNDATWREHSLTATAPAGAAEVKVGVMAESLRFNRIPEGAFDDAYFDDFSLTVAVDPGVPGDFDGDGDVDDDDFGVFAGAFGGAGPLGDFDNDGDVDDDDFGVFAGNFGTGVGEGTAVPEPGALALLAIGLSAIGSGAAAARSRR